MKDKGQALVEFILILPIVILVFIYLLDIGNIFLEKYGLNNSLEIITELYQNGKVNELNEYIDKEKISLEKSENNDIIKITIKKKIKTSAPGLNKIVDYIEAEKSIYKESNE